MSRSDVMAVRAGNDARDGHPRPPFPLQQQSLPGDDDRLDPPPDHGEATYVSSGRLTGLVTVVTGADSGIGKSVAIAFAREGADVVVSYLPRDALRPSEPSPVRGSPFPTATIRGETVDRSADHADQGRSRRVPFRPSSGMRAVATYAPGG